MADIKPKIGNTPPQRGDLKKDELGVDIQNAKLYIGLKDGNPLLISGDGTTWTNPEPTTAQDVDGIPSGTVVPTGLDAISILERILYPEYGVSFINLNTGISTSSELGTSFQNSNATITWNTTGDDDNWVANSANITYSGVSSGSLLSNGNPLAKTASVNYPSTFRATTLSNNSLTITLSGQQNVSGIVSNVSINSTNNWWSRIFWGRSTNSNLTSITGLGNQLLQSKNISSATLTSTGTIGYFYIFVHADYNITSLTSAGFDVAMNPTIGSITLNRNGLSLNYKIYRTSNIFNANTINILATFQYNV
jgi:hypothetical protein